MTKRKRNDGDGPTVPRDIDNAGALAALRRASIKARRRALEVTGSVPMWRNGEVVYESNPEVLFPDGMDDEPAASP